MGMGMKVIYAEFYDASIINLALMFEKSEKETDFIL